MRKNGLGEKIPYNTKKAITPTIANANINATIGLAKYLVTVCVICDIEVEDVVEVEVVVVLVGDVT